MRIEGHRSIPYSICLNSEGVIIGKGHRISSQMDYTLIPYEKINNIKYKDLWGKYEIKIKTKDQDKFKAQGFNPESAIGFVEFV